MSKHDRTVPAECHGCGKEYQQAQCLDLMDNATGQSVGGFNGKHWYGYDQQGDRVTYTDPENDDRVSFRWLNVYGYGGPRDVCPKCEERHNNRRIESSYYDSDVAPSDFDPTYAGERWNDDY
jgi:hypothetical protein